MEACIWYSSLNCIQNQELDSHMLIYSIILCITLHGQNPNTNAYISWMLVDQLNHKNEYFINLYFFLSLQEKTVSKSKKGKLSEQLKFCNNMVKELIAKKHAVSLYSFHYFLKQTMIKSQCNWCSSRRFWVCQSIHETPIFFF